MSDRIEPSFFHLFHKLLSLHTEFFVKIDNIFARVTGPTLVMTSKKHCNSRVSFELIQVHLCMEILFIHIATWCRASRVISPKEIEKYRLEFHGLSSTADESSLHTNGILLEWFFNTSQQTKSLQVIRGPWIIKAIIPREALVTYLSLWSRFHDEIPRLLFSTSVACRESGFSPKWPHQLQHVLTIQCQLSHSRYM